MTDDEQITATWELAWTVTLAGPGVRLEPLSLAHTDDLAAAVRDGELWKLWYTNIPEPDGTAAEIARRLGLRDRRSMIPFAIVDPRSGAAVGMTTYMNVEAGARRLEIGSTWYRASVQRTAINTESKLLLLTHAFDALGCIAVEFRTSSFNFRSRRAIERLGAKRDGILRCHARHANGVLRDTYVYSIVAAEWPTVRAHLQHLLRRESD